MSDRLVRFLVVVLGASIFLSNLSTVMAQVAKDDAEPASKPTANVICFRPLRGKRSAKAPLPKANTCAT